MRVSKKQLEEHKYKERRDKYINTSKEERAKSLGRIICPRCKYQNEIYYIKKYGTCNCCKATLDKDYFTKKLRRMM